MSKFLRIVLALLIIVCIFDPADKLLRLKVPLFVLAWLLFISDMIVNRKIVYVSTGMLIYLAIFILIPLISVAEYFFTGSDFVKYDGYQYLKSYLFATLVPILHVSKIDLTKPAVAIISALSAATIAILVINYFNPSLAMDLYTEVGNRYGIWSMGAKNYGRFILPDAPQIFFHTSTLVIIPIAYFTMKTFFSKGVIKTLYGLLLAMNIVAMFLGATKTNIVVSITMPMFIACWYSKRKKFILSGTIILLCILCIYNLGEIKSMFSFNEPSNSFKLNFIKDYLILFSDTKILLFGQGLGSYFYSSGRGYVSLSELTYFDFIRSFGLILSIPLFVLILYPLSKLRLKEYHSLHYIFLAYLFYLIMSFSNPLFVSSSGMLLLTLVLYKTFPTGFSFSLRQSHVSTKAVIID